ncbi:hypothetical protein J2S43_001260 [Catenuloplanes nepalensis]|uniref:Uncharacterized protein n=1 Tax=Catenuloplanes nepalensis TaxID=587533 RepID=A0ABT9MMY1_9ACTN|nr:hypothetical protein [Catenuloplanes nepalensis]
MFDVPPPDDGVRGVDAYRDIWPPFFAWAAVSWWVAALPKICTPRVVDGRRGSRAVAVCAVRMKKIRAGLMAVRAGVRADIGRRDTGCGEAATSCAGSGAEVDHVSQIVVKSAG